MPMHWLRRRHRPVNTLKMVVLASNRAALCNKKANIHPLVVSTMILTHSSFDEKQQVALLHTNRRLPFDFFNHHPFHLRA